MSGASDASDLGDMDDNAAGNNGDPIGHENVLLLALECIGYYLRWNNIIWRPITNPEDLRRGVEYEYFTPEIGQALVHHCMAPCGIIVAQSVGFDINSWLQMNDMDAFDYVDGHFRELLFVTPPLIEDFFRDLYIWTFVCQLCLGAARSNRGNLITYVYDNFSELMHNLCNISRFYYHLNTAANNYIGIHRELHLGSDDEGHYSDEGDDDDDDEDDDD